MTTLTRFRATERTYPVYRDARYGHTVKCRDVVRLYWDGEQWMTQTRTYLWGGHAWGWFEDPERPPRTPQPAITWNR